MAQASDTPREHDDPASGAPDIVEAAKPDDVAREPEDIAPDTADGEGEARRVDEEGVTEPMGGGAERPAPKAALVYNPIKVDQDRLRKAVAHESEKAGWSEPLFYETTVDDLGDDVTRQALKAGATTVLLPSERFDVAETFGLVERLKVTNMFAPSPKPWRGRGCRWRSSRAAPETCSPGTSASPSTDPSR